MIPSAGAAGVGAAGTEGVRLATMRRVKGWSSTAWSSLDRPAPPFL